ncbi:MAG: GspH/FimT family pseudopilin [Rhodocyclaceae bacterium]|nr:GspH/FimT family pseudopilin [Rhodocyclaceae bacterium]
MKPSWHKRGVACLRAQIQSGFTLVELMVTIAVLAILLAIAVPSFSEVMLSSRLRSYANDFVASSTLARGEAIKRNSVVNLCASSNGTSCVGNWEQGWIVLAGTTVIQRQQALSSGMKMVESGGAASLNFQSTGVGTTPTTLTICRATPSVGSQERVISVSATGRASVTKTATGVCP